MQPLSKRVNLLLTIVKSPRAILCNNKFRKVKIKDCLTDKRLREKAILVFYQSYEDQTKDDHKFLRSRSKTTAA